MLEWLNSYVYVIKERISFIQENQETFNEVSIDVWKHDTNQTMLEWFQTVERMRSVPITNIKIGGRESFLLVSPGSCGGPPTISAYIPADDLIFKIHYMGDASETSLQIYNQILDSFTTKTSKAETISNNIPNLSFLLSEFKLDNQFVCPNVIQASCIERRDGKCCGYTTRNRWPCGSIWTNYGWNDKGNCTWWADYTRMDVGEIASGSAEKWATQVRNSGQLPVDTTPKVGDIVVHPGSNYNHVAYVVWVAADKLSYKVSDMGWCSDCGPNPEEARLYTVDSNDEFIHCKGNPDIPTVNWVFKNCPFGWTPNKGFTGSSFSGSSWILNPDDDPYILSPIISLPANEYDSIEIHMSNNAQNTQGQIFFTTDSQPNFDETKSVRFSTTSGSHWDNYTINMSTNPLWRGVITRIRIDPVASGNANGSYDNIGIGRVSLIRALLGDPPTISFDQANVAVPPSDGTLCSNNPNWTFAGTAADPQNALANVSFWCSGQSCNVPATPIATPGYTWSYSRNGLYGFNEIAFRAKNGSGQESDPARLNLYVDNIPPVTERAPRDMSKWFNQVAVPITLSFTDTSPDNRPPKCANLGYRIHYRVDGGAWMQVANQNAVFTVSGEGIHTVEYYSVDGVGNQETTRSFQVKIDATPPSAPGSIVETHGVVSGQWQRAISDPTFTWTPATDTGSGVDYYYITGWPFLGGRRDSPSFDPPAVRTGSYTFEVFAFDKAGNEGPRRSFTFNYDGTPPPAPAIENLDGVASGVWQNQVRTANFQWPTPVDAGSGVKGYYRYWGADPNGTSAVLVTSNAFSTPTPFCAEDDACTHYLRARSEDHVGWQSDWTTFVMRYDGVPPTAELVANYGLPTAHQTLVHLAISASDLGSGVTQMRLSNGGYTWSDWRPLANELYWEIPAIGRRNHDIYLQVVDAAGNLSRIISDTVYFDVNAPYPKSEAFQLWNWLTPAGAGIISDTTRTLRVTVGQPSTALPIQSAQYWLIPGFQAAALAVPTQTVTYTTYSQIGSLFASAATTATALSSAQHRLYGSLGQPSDMRTVSSANFTADLGFWGGAARDVTPQPPEPPAPPIPPECEFYSLSINNGALFTRSPLVTLNLCGPDPVQVMLSNDGGFGGSTWQPYTRAISWTLTTYGNTIIPRFAYARFRDSQSIIHGNFMDDIIYDPNAPQGMAAFNPADLPDIGVLQQGHTAWIMALGRPRTLRVIHEPQAQLYLSARDDSSGLAAMQISASPDFTDAEWQPFQAITPVTFEGEGMHTVYVRTRDAAGNISAAFSDQLIVDLTPPTLSPTGTIRVLEEVVSRGALTVTVAISATDNIGIHEARVSLSEAFTDTLWVLYAPHLVTPIRFTGELTPTLYVQLRDAAGNTSAIYTTTYLVDVTPPYGTVELVALDGTVGTLQLSAEDDLSPVTRLWLSPDFWFFQNVTVRAYAETLTWDFGDSDALYIMFEDAAGNRSWPYWIGPEQVERPENTVFLPLVLRQQ